MLNLASILFQLQKMEEILVFPHEMVTPDNDAVVIAVVANIGWSITVNDEPLLVYHGFFLLFSYIDTGDTIKSTIVPASLTKYNRIMHLHTQWKGNSGRRTPVEVSPEHMWPTFKVTVWINLAWIGSQDTLVHKICNINLYTTQCTLAL